MITLTIIFTIFYLKYLRRLIITYRRKKAKGESIDDWLNNDATYVEAGTVITSMIIAPILAITLIILAIKYLP